jgi:hypothetical protein
LLLFGKQRGEPEAAPLKLHLVVAGVTALGWGLFSFHVVRSGYMPAGFAPPDTMPQAVRLSVLVAVAYCFSTLRELANFRALYRPLFYLRAVATFEGGLAIAVLISVKYAQARWSVPEARGFDTWMTSTALFSTFKPGVFLLGYVVYFGPIVLVTVLRWRDVVALLQRHGAGLVVIGMLGALFSLDSEARHGYTFVAIILPFVVKVVDDLNLPRKALIQLALLTAVFSKVWLTLPPDVPGPAGDFPAQTVFMSQGPWISNMMYLVQMPIVLLVGFWLRALMLRRDVALAAGTSRPTQLGHVELRVTRQDSIRSLSRDTDELGSTNHVAVLGSQGP